MSMCSDNHVLIILARFHLFLLPPPRSKAANTNSGFLRQIEALVTLQDEAVGVVELFRYGHN